MISRTFKLCLNAGSGSAPYINVNQYDEGETWLFELYSENGERYIPSSGAIVGVKSDGHGIVNTGTVDSEGRVVITETQQMTASAGRAIYELSIDGLTHGTANFIVAVERKPTDDAVMSDSDLSLIQEAIDSAEVIVEVIGDGDPSEVIGEHVDAWLDNHPEATTTVEDGAITAPKINQSLWDKLLVSEEASGAVASFDDGADDVPVSSLKVALEPIQLGSGDPSPSNVRPIIASNGKNLLQVTATNQTIDGVTFTVDANGVITANGTATANIQYIVADATFIANAPSSTYFMSGCPSGGSNKKYRMAIVGGTGSDVGNGVSVVYSGSISDTRVRISIMSGTVCNNLVFKPMIRLASITDFTYQPYQGIMVERCGKNLVQKIAKGYIRIESNQYIADGASESVLFYATKGATYTVSASVPLTRSVIARTASDNVSATCPVYDVLTVYPSFTWTATFSGWAIWYIHPSLDADIEASAMVEVGTTASDYEAPKTPTQYPYTLGQSVYGGTVDLATGVLTVTWASRTINGSENWARENGSATHYKYYINANDIGKPIGNNYKAEGTIICDKLTTAVNSFDYTTDSVAVTAWANHSVDNNYLYLIVNNANMGFDNVDGLKAWLASNPLQVVYLLATPTTVQLTSTEVKTLLGYNNISSTGTVEVIYHADTKLYVDKMTNVDNAIIAPTEADFVATRNYTVNDLVIVNDTLYKVTSNIQNGGTITPNSNVQQTTLGALIKALS